MYYLVTTYICNEKMFRKVRKHIYHIIITYKV